MIQSRGVAIAAVVYVALSTGFATVWLMGLPLAPTTSTGWVLLLVGAVPASIAIEFAGSRVIGAVDYPSGARPLHVWISRTLLVASLAVTVAACMWISGIVRSA